VRFVLLFWCIDFNCAIAFLGNQFLQVLGENFSVHFIPNPDRLSEIRLLSQLAPTLDESLIGKLVDVFQDLRSYYDDGTLGYPYSLRGM
jgi:von Willebrand factor A domain-containing protein 8